MIGKRFTLIDMNNIEWKLISPIKDNGRDITVKQVVDLLNVQHEEIIELKSEINMLKTTISRNEAYIERLTHKGEWR